jgi:hypothetical protein
MLPITGASAATGSPAATMVAFSSKQVRIWGCLFFHSHGLFWQ